MKKSLALLLAFIMLISLLPVTSFAADEINVYISVAEDGCFVKDKNDKPIANRKISVTAENPTINDAFVKLHDDFYDGGSADGYVTTESSWGALITKFFGKDASYSGYYNNHSYAMGVTDSISDGSYISFWFYQDTVSWSDKYVNFDKLNCTVSGGEAVELTLTGDTTPVKDAIITVDGTATEKVTDENGSATLYFANEGEYIISAKSNNEVLVPPVCTVTVTDDDADAENIVLTDSEALTIADTAENDINLPLTGQSGKTSITWESSDESVISASGKVTKNSTENSVTLTATIKYGEYSNQEYFDITVPALTVDRPSDKQILDNIAKAYASQSAEWKLMDMAAYEKLYPDAENKTTDDAKQEYIKSIIEKLEKSELDEAGLAKAIIILTSIGIDSEKLYPADSEESISAVEKLIAIENNSTSAWVAPYTILALSQNNYNAEEKINAIISSVIAAQNDDGSWTEWGDSIQTTSNIIACLSLYYNSNADVKTALDKAIKYLSSVQAEDGTFDAYGYGPDTNTTAMVVIALAAMGINPDTDDRFIKNDISVYDALYNNVTVEFDGFGYQNKTYNDYSTEQGFRAVIAAVNVMEQNKPYNVYDFSANELAPGKAEDTVSEDDDTTGGDTTGGSSTPSVKKISVYFTLLGDKLHDENTVHTYKHTSKKLEKWVKKSHYNISEGTTALELFKMAAKDNDIEYKLENEYICEIQSPTTDEWLGEYSNGSKSGWMFVVNNEFPTKGLGDLILESGDNMIVVYTDDYTIEDASIAYAPGNSTGVIGGNGSADAKDEDKTESTTETEQKDNAETVPSNENTTAFTDVKAGEWYTESVTWSTQKGLFKGTSENTFSPNEGMTRSMLATVLYRLDGENPTEASGTFTDVKNGEWYSNAINWAATSGIVNGYDDNTFGINDMITRQQLAVMLYRYTGKETDADLNVFSDTALIESWAISAIKWAVSNGIINGNTDGTLNPQGNATRAEVAAIMYRLSKILE